jgi:hypothetical protein
MRSPAAVANDSRQVAPEALSPRRSLRDFVQSSGLRSLVLGTSKDPNAKITVLLVSPEDSRCLL